MRTRLVRTAEDLAKVDYTVLRSHEEWPDHKLRVGVTSAILHWMSPRDVLDPACGDGSVVLGSGVRPAVLGDVSALNISRLSGGMYAMVHTRVGDVFDTLADTDPVDTIVLTEIVEHVEDPVALLALAGTKAERLLVSSPEMRPGQVDNNPEHLWMFDGEGYEEMLNETGWKAYHKTHLTFRSDYNFQIWVCDRG